MKTVNTEATLRPADEQDVNVANDGTLAALAATKESRVLAVPPPPPRAVADFAARHDQNVANGYYLHHLESYLLPDNHIRVNAIWNKAWGGVATTWVQGWAEADLAPKLTQMKNSGWRVRHLNAWNLPNNGDVRFDVVWEQLTWRDEVVRLNMTGAHVVQEYGTQWNRAFKLRTLDTFRIGNEQRYAGVWNPNT
ncbi:MAG: hypothetical protein ACT4QB_13745, partial [Gammaproteobacteria bacterium]